MSDPEDYRSVFPMAEDDPWRPSPLARAVLWATAAVMAMIAIAIVLAVVSTMIDGQWWVRP